VVKGGRRSGSLALAHYRGYRENSARYFIQLKTARETHRRREWTARIDCLKDNRKTERSTFVGRRGQRVRDAGPAVVGVVIFYRYPFAR